MFTDRDNHVWGGPPEAAPRGFGKSALPGIAAQTGREFFLARRFNPLDSRFVMNAANPRGASRGKFREEFTVRLAAAIVAGVCACGAFFFSPDAAAQRDLPPNTLWEVVRNLCVPGQTEFHDPKPCLEVSLTSGTERGFAILRDPRGGTQFLLIPTTRIAGIESSILRAREAPNYFANAWNSRGYVSAALHQALWRDGIGLAINSAISRSQDQMHIHLSCLRAGALETLRKNESKIGDRWALLPAPLAGHYYQAMWLTGEDLNAYNPFRLLAENLPEAARDMGNYTLVVVGWTRSDGTRGFVLLTDQFNRVTGDQAFGEELLDRECHIAASGTKDPGEPAHRGSD
jgi:CDP-diacylglycerol pyrophosphatase